MNILQRMAETLERELARMDGLKQAADEFKRIGDLEQHENELRSLIETHERKLKDLRDLHSQALASASQEIKIGETSRTRSEKEAVRIEKAAEAKAADIVRMAGIQADKLLSDAAAKKERIEQEAFEAKKTKGVILEEILGHQQRLKEIKEEIAAMAKRWT